MAQNFLEDSFLLLSTFNNQNFQECMPLKQENIIMWDNTCFPYTLISHSCSCMLITRFNNHKIKLVLKRRVHGLAHAHESKCCFFRCARCSKNTSNTIS